MPATMTTLDALELTAERDDEACVAVNLLRAGAIGEAEAVDRCVRAIVAALDSAVMEADGYIEAIDDATRLAMYAAIADGRAARGVARRSLAARHKR